MGSAPRRPGVGVRTAAALVVVAAVGWWVYAQSAPPGPIGGAGTIEATPVGLTAYLPGRVLRLLAREGDTVKAGEVVAELEPQEAAAQVAAAQAAVQQAAAQVGDAERAVAAQEQVTGAQVGAAQAQVTTAGTGVPQTETQLAIAERTLRDAVASATAQAASAEAQVGGAESALVTARNNLGREKMLFAQGAVSADEVDAVQAAYDAAVAQRRSAGDAVTQAQANVASARTNLRQVEIQAQAVTAAHAGVAAAHAGLANAQAGYTVIAQRRQDLAAAQAALAQARANLTYLQVIAGHNVVVSPRAAVVQTKYVEEGEVVAAGTPLFTLVDLHDIWLRAYVPEDQIAEVKVGQGARVSIDSFPNRIFEGRVVEISSKGEFTPVNVQTVGDRVKLVFSVKIQLTNDDLSLKPGMPADAEILVGTEHDRTPR